MVLIVALFMSFSLQGCHLDRSMAGVTGTLGVFDVMYVGVSQKLLSGTVLDVKGLCCIESMEEIERGVLERQVNTCAISKEDGWKPLIPVLLRLLISKNGQALIEEPVEPFGQGVPLQMSGCGVLLPNVHPFTKPLEDVTDEVGSFVAMNAPGNSIFAENAGVDSVCHGFCCSVGCGYCDGVSGKSIDHHENLGISSRGFREVTEKVNVNYIKRLHGDWEVLKGSVSGGLGWIA